MRSSRFSESIHCGGIALKKRETNSGNSGTEVNQIYFGNSEAVGEVEASNVSIKSS